MKCDDRHHDRTESYTRGLLAVAVLLGALVLLRIAGFVTASAQARAMAATADPNGRGVAEVGKLLAGAQACAEELKKKNLFIVVPPKQHPVGEVRGILGEEALINGQWYKAGDSVEDAKIVAIEPTKVRVAWNGQETEFLPIASASVEGGSERSGPPSRGERSGPRRGPTSVMTGSRGAAPGQMQGRPSPEEINKMRERMQNMSPEERRRAMQEMRQRFEARPQ
ncbi:MAG: hypothetical protein KBE65_18160 [Phycisphaerae bacterium]|nr:hypothetical protein [Phycisphaerae bacterium]